MCVSWRRGIRDLISQGFGINGTLRNGSRMTQICGSRRDYESEVPIEAMVLDAYLCAVLSLHMVEYELSL